MNRNKVLGVSSKYEFGRWEHVLYGPFASDEEAEERFVLAYPNS